MFGGSSKKDKEELARLHAELSAAQEELGSKEADLERERQRAEDRERANAELEARQASLESRHTSLEARQASLEAARDEASAEGAAELAAVEKARDALSAEKRDAELRSEETQRDLDAARSAAQSAKDALDKQLLESRRKSEALAAEKAAANAFLDVTISDCEFASAFSYFLVLQMRPALGADRQATDISQPSTRPVFNRASFLLSADIADWGDEASLNIAAFVSITDPAAVSAEPVSRLLGEAQIPLTDLEVSSGGSASRRVVRNVNFLRTAGTGSASGPGGKELTVGRANVELQVKIMGPTEAAATTSSILATASAAAPLPPTAPSLNKTLWLARPLQPCLRALVHWAEALPAAPEGGRATARVVLRLLRPDGQVLHEAASPDVVVVASSSSAGAAAGEARFGFEVSLPLRKASAPKDITVQLSLEMISADATAGDSAHLATLLDLRWHPEALPPFAPLHVLAKPSSSGSTVPSFARPRPSLLVSLVCDPAHEALDGLGDGASGYCAEFRVHGVPAGRPLPAAAEGAIVAICPEPESHGSCQIPVTTYFYDQRMDFSSFVASHFRNGALKGTSYFLTPPASRSRTPQWGQFILRLTASLGSLSKMSVLVFDCGGARAEVGADSFVSGRLLGFATLDASALAPVREAGVPAQPLQRSFLLDLRLMEDPGAAASLEIECRVWPRGGVPAGVPSMSSPTLAARGGAGTANATLAVATLPPPVDAAAKAATAESVHQEAREFRLSHELSVQLSKEFNLRAAALKRAGEEIVALRRQVQLLQNENVKLKAQLQDEEKLAEEVQCRPIPEGLDKLSSAELAQKLQRALDRYREEKAKGAEVTQRLEEALREAARGRGLQRALTELEQAHFEQNRELQRLQEEGRKLETYRQTTKTQEKVIVKLEKILEGSLAEVQKAQRVQVDVERLKTENLKLREKCANLVANRRATASVGAGAAEELQRQVAEKDAEILRLEGVLRDLQSARQAETESPELAQERRRLRELEDSRAEWEQRCGAAEQRLAMLQRQLEESSKKYGGEISSLKVEIAKRDAKVKELEFLLGQPSGSAPATVPGRPPGAGIGSFGEAAPGHGGAAL